MRRIATVPLLFRALLLNMALVATAAAYVTVGSGGQTPCNYADLQAAIDSSPNDAEFHVVYSYHGKPIRFSNKALKIYGGYADCTGTTTTPGMSSLDGSLDSGTKPVLQIDGQVSLDLRGFVVGNGHNSGNAGGGIRFFSSGAGGHVELHDVTIASNRADIGGGIFYNGGSSGRDDLVLFEGSQIVNNFANHAGGGIRLEGHARLIAERPQTWISGNTADPNFSDDGNGGGVQLLDASSASIGSPGFNGFAVIHNNTARRGGGLAIQDLSVARLYTTQSGNPARVEYNTATVYGGGVYLFPKNQDGALIPTLCGYGFGINHNTSANGGAIYADQDTAFFTINVGDDVELTKQSCGGLPANHAACLANTPCNTIDGNTTTQPDGATIRALGEAQTHVEAEDLELRGNSASHVLSVSGEFGLSLSNCLIAENRSSDSGLLIATSDAQTPTVIDSCTITNNTLAGTPEIDALQGIAITHSILWQAGSSAVRIKGSGTLQYADVISNVTDFQGFGATSSPNVRFVDPQFVDPAGDYHLQASSPGIDYAFTGIANDLDGNARAIVLKNAGTPFDIGAYERQTLSAVTFPPLETFDEIDPTVVQLPFGWTNDVTNDTGTTSGWTISGDSPFTGTFAAHADDPDGITDASLETPAFRIARDGQASFYHRFALDFYDNTAGGGDITYYDGAVLEISIGGGAFRDIIAAGGRFITGGYNHAISTQWFSPIAGRAAWSGSSAGWTKVDALLPVSANGQTVQLRWRVASDQANGAPGYWLDSINVIADRILRADFEPAVDTIFKQGFER